jgi:hypothetical protein
MSPTLVHYLSSQYIPQKEVDMPFITVTHVSEHLIPMSPVYTPLEGRGGDNGQNFWQSEYF